MILNKAFLIATIQDLKFYEHPYLRDEAPLLVKYGREIMYTDIWDNPTIQDAEYYREKFQLGV